MEDLWKLNNLDYRIDTVADRAEYNRMIKRFREEEERENRKRLLFGEDHIDPQTNP